MSDVDMADNGLGSYLGWVFITFIMLCVVVAAWCVYVWPAVVRVYNHCAYGLYWALRTWRKNMRGGSHYYHGRYARRDHYTEGE